MPSLKPHTVIHADDHNFFRLGFRKVMEAKNDISVRFIEEAKDGMELIEKVGRHHPDVVMTDIKMPNLDGIQACRIIKSRYPSTSVIAFSGFDNEHSILDMMSAGADGYLVKTTTGDEVIEAIRTVTNGYSYFCTTASDQINGSFTSMRKRGTLPTCFSLQEIRVMKLICKQLSTKEIAMAMKLAVRTVEDYRQHLLEKTGARNVVGIALYALMNQVVKASELT